MMTLEIVSSPIPTFGILTILYLNWMEIPVEFKTPIFLYLNRMVTPTFAGILTFLYLN